MFRGVTGRQDAPNLRRQAVPPCAGRLASLADTLSRPFAPKFGAALQALPWLCLVDTIGLWFGIFFIAAHGFD